MEIDGETVEIVSDLIFLVSNITADGDCSHEIKRCLLLGRKAMTNLESVLKIRNTTLQTKVCIVKGMIFPVVMYGCESWTIKKAECPMNQCFWTVVLEKTLENPLDCKIKPVNPKGYQPWILEVLMLKLQYFGHLIWKANSLAKTMMLGNSEGKRWRGWQRIRWLNGNTDSMDTSLSKLR